MTNQSPESEADAYSWFYETRWPSGARCPFCECARPYVMLHGIFRCAECRRDFSVTTATPFEYLKLPFTTLVAAITAYRAGINRHAASKMLGVQYRTAFNLWPRIRVFLSDGASRQDDAAPLQRDEQQSPPNPTEAGR